MIEKMKFISITGPVADFDRVVDTYLTRYDIHLENALSELKSERNIRPFVEANPYRDDLNRVTELLEDLEPEEVESSPMSAAEAHSLIEEVRESIAEHRTEYRKLSDEIDDIGSVIASIKPFAGLDFSMSDANSLTSICYCFGRVSQSYYRSFMKYADNDANIIFIPSEVNNDYAYGVYFSPATQIEKTEAICTSLHFEEMDFPEGDGTPFDIMNSLKTRMSDIVGKAEEVHMEIEKVLHERYDQLKSAQKLLQSLSTGFEVRKLSACTKKGDQTFFILCGWMPAAQTEDFQNEIASEKEVYTIIDEELGNGALKPPTRLKNPAIFRPFEMYTEMYGLPAYNEMDPTIFIALTYSFIFGCMFGDVGHGLFLLLGGLLLYKLKNMKLAAIIAGAGVFSTIFGFMFGSIFGYEDIIKAVWLKPKDAMTALPFVGNLNTVFVIAIAFGMGLVLITMIINIINSLKAHDIENALFSNNGAAGIVFYGMIALCVVLFMTGHKLPAGIFLVLLLGTPVVLMIFKEQIAHAITKTKAHEKTGIGMFIAQAFFEMFEVMLSYFSNTLSFVRIGAFAVSHAAMMEVVMMLAGAESGNPSMVVVVLGNLFVIGMEGLIVGIQVLRLEYYEFFSRFYKGSGREFKSYRQSLIK